MTKQQLQRCPKLSSDASDDLAEQSPAPITVITVHTRETGTESEPFLYAGKLQIQAEP